MDIIKYVRTPHLQGSRLQQGDSTEGQVPYAHLKGKYVVLEEKFDGANFGARQTQDNHTILQSRGHFLTGGGRERHFNLLKSWVNSKEAYFDQILGQRYQLFGEWMYAKHTVFYDQLPHYALEFDILDLETNDFMSTKWRHERLAGGPVVSVPVLYAGIAPRTLKELLSYIRMSLGKSDNHNAMLRATTHRSGLDVEQVLAQTRPSDLSEGLYIKVEENGVVTERYKWVMADFVQAMTESDSHWHSRPILPNQLMPGVDIFADVAASWPTRN